MGLSDARCEPPCRLNLPRHEAACEICRTAWRYAGIVALTGNGFGSHARLDSRERAMAAQKASMTQHRRKNLRNSNRRYECGKFRTTFIPCAVTGDLHAPLFLMSEMSGAALLKEVGGRRLAGAIKVVEGSEVSLGVIQTLGLGVAPGIRLMDTSGDAALAATTRVAVATALYDADPGKLKKYSTLADGAERKAAAILAIVRVLSLLTDRLRSLTLGLGNHQSVTAGLPTSYVVTQTEDERNFTLPAFGGDDMRDQRKVLKEMYNLRPTDHELPTLSQLKKIGYWVKSANCWPDPSRVGLKHMKRSEEDSAFTCFKRLAFGVALVAAGSTLPPGLRDEGAGHTDDFGVQMAHGIVIDELVSEVEEFRDPLDESVMRNVGKLLCKGLHKASSRGGASISLAVQRQIGEVTRLASAHQKGTPSESEDGGDDYGSPAPKKQRTPRKSRNRKPGKGNKRLAFEDDDDEPTSSFKDEEGALGPNKLKRKKGGNAQGARARTHTSLMDIRAGICTALR